jgi:hypothetical protein
MMNKLQRREWRKKQKLVIKDLNKLERKYGTPLLKSSISRKLMEDRETEKRIKDIARMEEELRELKKGKFVY